MLALLHICFLCFSHRLSIFTVCSVHPDYCLFVGWKKNCLRKKLVRSDRNSALLLATSNAYIYSINNDMILWRKRGHSSATRAKWNSITCVPRITHNFIVSNEIGRQGKKWRRQNGVGAFEWLRFICLHFKLKFMWSRNRQHLPVGLRRPWNGI